MKLRISIESEVRDTALGSVMKADVEVTDGDGRTLRVADAQVTSTVVTRGLDSVETEITLDLPEIERAE